MLFWVESCWHDIRRRELSHVVATMPRPLNFSWNHTGFSGGQHWCKLWSIQTSQSCWPSEGNSTFRFLAKDAALFVIAREHTYATTGRTYVKLSKQIGREKEGRKVDWRWYTVMCWLWKIMMVLIMLEGSFSVLGFFHVDWLVAKDQCFFLFKGTPPKWNISALHDPYQIVW